VLRRPFPVAIIAAGTAGALLSLSNPPTDVGPIALVALVPFLWALRGTSMRRGALLGFVFGLVYYGILVSWLLLFGFIAWFPLVAAQAAYAALFGLLFPVLWRDRSPLRSAAAAAALWTAVDWARGAWPLGGFTWGGLGYTQHGNGFVLPLASVTGVWGVTFVVILMNALVLGGLLWLYSDRRLVSAAALLAVGLAASSLPALIPVPAAAGPRLRVAVVQGNVPRALASQRFLQSDVVADNHIRLNRQLSVDPPDLAIWPENALDDDPAANRALGARVADSIRAVGAPTLVGAITDAPGDHFYNQMLFYSGQGEIVGRYTKIHLVPFGEYVPFRRFLGWVEELRAVPRDLLPGRRFDLFDVKGLKVAAPICFENTAPNLFRTFVDRGANIVVLGTNDSSFQLSVASKEHVIMSQVRAVENARWIVQAAISGESAIIDPSGRVVVHTGLFVPTIVRYDVPSGHAKTLYTRFGDWFPWACGLAVVAVLMAVGERRFGRRGRAGASAPPAGERLVDSRSRLDSDGEPLPIQISGGEEARVLVVLPTYNERATILQVISGVLKAVPGAEVLVIDDGSPDGTGDAVAAVAKEEARVRLLRRSGKMGLASAYLLGFGQAIADGFDLAVEMDADLSHVPEELPALLQGGTVHDLTIGSRYVPGGSVTNWSRSRIALSRAGNLYARLMLGIPVSDATSGYRLYRRPLLEALLAERTTSDGYAFQIEMAYRAWRMGFSLGEVPISFRERQHGRSKLSRAIVVEALFKVTQWGIRDRLRRPRAAREPLPRGRRSGR
jgi:apolipoprotein N-acyltransferase